MEIRNGGIIFATRRIAYEYASKGTEAEKVANPIKNPLRTKKIGTPIPPVSESAVSTLPIVEAELK
jgi:hypothetical protein